MSPLFIELYLDGDVDVLVAELLRARGFGAITTQEAGQLQSSDADQLAYAVSHRQDIPQQVKQAGGKWNRRRQVWELRYDQVVALKLEART